MIATFFSNVAKDITTSFNNLINATNTTELLASAQKLPDTVINTILEASNLPEQAPKPLSEQTRHVVQETTKELLEQTETGKEILRYAQTQNSAITTELAKIHQQKIALFKKINKTWKIVTKDIEALGKALMVRIEDPQIIIRDLGDVVERADNFTKDTFEYFTGIKRGVCHLPPANATVWNACIEPPLECVTHLASPLRDMTCCTLPTQCVPAIARNKEYLMEYAQNATTSFIHTLGQTGLSTTFGFYPFLDTKHLPPQNQTDPATWSTSAGVIASSLLGYFSLAMAGIQQNQLARSLPFGAAVGSAAAALWGTNPMYGAIKGGISSMAIDSVFYYPLEALVHKIQNNANLQRIGTALPLALTSLTALGIFAMQPYCSYEAWDLVGSSYFAALFPVTTLYAISSWSRGVIHTSLPLITAPIVAYASLVASETYLDATSSYFPGGIYGASGTLLTMVMGLLTLQYRRIFARA